MNIIDIIQAAAASPRDHFHNIAVEGPIGCGKSSLTKSLAKALGPRTMALFEPDQDNGLNPYLDDFYKDMTRWGFTVQAHMLGRRFARQKLAQEWVSNGMGHAINDRCYYGDTCFLQMLHEMGRIDDRELESYTQLFKHMTSFVLLPTVCVRIMVSLRTTENRIRRRAAERDTRKSESAIDLDYLRRLDEKIGSMTDTLRSQGVRVFEMPWDLDRDERDRDEAASHLAEQITSVKPSDLFVHAFRRLT